MSPSPAPAPVATRRRVAVNALLLLGAQGAATVLGVAQAGMVSRGLGVAGFGAWSLLMSVAASLQMAADFGLGTVMVRDLARRPERAGEDLAGALALRLAIAAAGSAGVAVIAWRGEGLLGGAPLAAVVIGLTPLATAVAGVGRAVFFFGRSLVTGRPNKDSGTETEDSKQHRRIFYKNA